MCQHLLKELLLFEILHKDYCPTLYGLYSKTASTYLALSILINTNTYALYTAAVALALALALAEADNYT